MDLTEIRNNREVLKETKTALEIAVFDSGELEELCENLGGIDFQIELDGSEYRFIDDNSIEDIFAESVQNMIEECYITEDMPSLIVGHLNWDGIVRDCMMDGYGHHFSGYDGSENGVTGYYIFRTN